MSQRVIRRKLFNAVSTSRKLPVIGRLLLPFHDAVLVVHGQHGLQPLALAVASLHFFSFVAHSRLFTVNLFCLVFDNRFNIMTALFVNQSPSVPQKNRFSRRFVLMLKRVSMCMRQNEFLFKQTAICSCFEAIWC